MEDSFRLKETPNSDSNLRYGPSTPEVSKSTSSAINLSKNYRCHDELESLGKMEDSQHGTFQTVVLRLLKRKVEHYQAFYSLLCIASQSPARNGCRVLRAARRLTQAS